MNREIKFRAWIKDAKIIVDWKFMLSCEEPTQAQHSFTDWFTAPNNVVLMQYTGLKDKNGKEIYEGDVVLHNQQKRVVVFRLGMFQLLQKNLTYVREWWNWCKYTEVVGNIYENPELNIK